MRENCSQTFQLRAYLAAFTTLEVHSILIKITRQAEEIRIFTLKPKDVIYGEGFQLF